MKRNEHILKLKKDKNFDCIIIGGGSSGCALALDAASRGYKTLLLESYDFSKGTSSRSTKLLHGGVRYLAQAEFSLVYEALHERNRFFQNAPHLCKPQKFIIVSKNFFQALYYYLGLKLYDFLAGSSKLEKTQFLSKNTLKKAMLGIKEKKACFGISYTDGRFDDSRMALAMLKKACEYEACVLNYAEVTTLLKDEQGFIKGLSFKDKINNENFEAFSACVINATGVFSQNIHTMDSSSEDLVLSQGVHIVLDKEFFPNENALMIPKTSDNRVLFAIPWYEKVLVGTTDTEIKKLSYEPKAFDEEIEFILQNASHLLEKKPEKKDIKSVFAGLRPLIKSSDKESKKLSRSHKITLHKSKLLSLNGGKYTTTRAMAEQCLDNAIAANLLIYKECKTKDLKLDDEAKDFNFDSRLSVYGAKAEFIQELEKGELKRQIHPNYAYTYAQIFYALEEEMAQNIEDILARRIRLLFIDAKACEECAFEVNAFLAKYFHWDKNKEEQELQAFLNLVKNYQI